MKALKILLLTGGITTGIFAQEQQVKDSSLMQTQKLDEVLVKAIRLKETAPLAFTNFSKEQIRERNLGQDIPILLNYLPGVVSTTDAGTGIGYTYMRVRGSDPTRINVTLNGIPFNDAESQGTFWVNLPDFASSIENMQLQRGVGTSTNGSGAFGASLNLLTDAVSEDAYGEISNSFGSFNTRKHTVKFSSGLLNNAFEVSGRLSKIDSDGYIDRAFSDLKSYFLQGAYQTENTLIKALAFGGHEITYQAWFGIDRETLATNRRFNPAGMFTDEEGNLRFYDNEVDDYKQDHYQLHWHQKWSERWKTTMSLNYTYGRGFFEQFREDDDFSTYGFTPVVVNGEVVNTTDLVRRRWLDNDFYVVNTQLIYETEKTDWQTGLFYSRYLGDHFGEVIWARFAAQSEIRDRYYFSDADKQDISVFSKITHNLSNKWQLYLDLQGRFVKYETQGITSDILPIDIDKNFEFFNPKAGLTYLINPQNHFFLSFARAHREPNRNDFEQDIETAERLDDYELGWRYKSKKFSVNATLYYMDYKNQLVLTGELNDVGAPLRTNSGESFRTGLEIDAELRVHRHWSIRPNLALSKNKNQNFVAIRDGEPFNFGTTNLPFSPEIVAGNTISWKPNERLQVQWLSKYVGEQYMGNVDSATSKLDDYFVNDLVASYSFKPGFGIKKAMVQLMVNNVFNVKYVSNGFFFTFEDTFTNPGQSVTVEGAGFYPQAQINFLTGLSLFF
ncbi:MAG: TonB-dependent receptor [Flavobacteriaceae bacterium]|nr:TonB-dependent receptor [Flavobacteriaceae bacterium]